MASRDDKAQQIIRAAKALQGDPYDELDDDLQSDFGFDVHADMKRRLERLESQVAQQQVDPQVEAGKRVLAKAQEALHRDFTPAGIRERAMRAFSDPTQVGVVEGYLAVGTHAALVKAAELVGQAEERIERTNASAALTGLEQEYGLGDDTTERLAQEVAQLRELTSALLQRVSQFEAGTSAPSQMVSPVIAKGFTRTSDVPQHNVSAAELMTRAQGVIDSPQQIGVLSSLIDEGKLEQVRRAVEAAEREHDARVKAAERKRLR